MKSQRPPERPISRPVAVVRGGSAFDAKLAQEYAELPGEITSQAVVLAHIYDLVVALLVAIWLGGGIPWGGHALLRHGADPRRAALIIGLVGAFVFRRVELGAYLSSRVIHWTRLAAEALRNSRVRKLVLVGCAGWAIFAGVVQMEALRTPLYDVGIFHQILWGLSHGYGFLSTISKAGNFLMDHLSPSLVLLVPAYWISASSPLTLAFVQPALFFGGVMAWVHLAENAPSTTPEIREELAAATVLFGISFDSLWGNLRWGFHENSIAFFALSWAFALLFPYLYEAIIDPWAAGGAESSTAIGPETEWKERPTKKLAVIVLLLIAAASKEIVLVDVAGVFFVWAVLEFLNAQDDRVGRGSTLAAALFSLAGVCLLVFVIYEGIHHPADKNYFDRYYSYLGHDLGGATGSFLTAPFAVVNAVGMGNLVHYLAAVLLPWLCLPLFWGAVGPEKLWLLAIAPSFLSAAMSTYGPLRDLNFHYALELWPLLAALTLLQLAKLKSKKLIWAWALLALLMMDHDPWGAVREDLAEAKRMAPVREEMVGMPTGLSIMADDLAGPWIAGREMVARWPDLDLFNHACPGALIGRVDDQGRSLEQPDVISLLKRCSKQSPRVSVIWKSEEWRAYVPW